MRKPSFGKVIINTLPLAVCEGVGMGLFTFLVTGVVVGNASYGLMTIWLSLSLCISILGPTTGGHVNPAVTLVLLLCGLFGGLGNGKSKHDKKDPKRFVVIQSCLYMVFQFLGAICASLLARWWVGQEMGTDTLQVFVDALAANKNDWTRAILVEIFATMLLTFTVTCLVYRGAGGPVGPFLVGLTVLFSGEMGGNWSGGWFNPGLVVGIVTSGVVWTDSNVYAGDVPGFEGMSYSSFATIVVFGFILSQFLGAIFAYGLHWFFQFAHKQHSEMISHKKTHHSEEYYTEHIAGDTLGSGQHIETIEVIVSD